MFTRKKTRLYIDNLDFSIEKYLFAIDKKGNA